MRIKRVFDIFFSLCGLLFLAPLLLAIALWIKADSSGPVFFRQVRVGRHGRPFRIFKFRTMCVDAEAKGRLITVGDDIRITRAGRFLRNYKFDELPQLLNVVRGEMSLVGPRPEVPKYVAVYPEDVRMRVLSVPPGITDTASICYRDENELLAEAADPDELYVNTILPAKLAYYERYVAQRSLGFDFMLIVRTLVAIFSHQQASESYCGTASGR